MLDGGIGFLLVGGDDLLRCSLYLAEVRLPAAPQLGERLCIMIDATEGKRRLLGLEILGDKGLKRGDLLRVATLLDRAFIDLNQSVDVAAVRL